jgi:hypothetical protein
VNVTPPINKTDLYGYMSPVIPVSGWLTDEIFRSSPTHGKEKSVALFQILK